MKTLFAMAMDFLAIQVSSVPRKCTFSSVAETNTNYQNRIQLVLIEALQILKFGLKQECLDFTSG
jgi:hypothetical protein